jgi:hypothetical protein
VAEPSPTAGRPRPVLGWYAPVLLALAYALHCRVLNYVSDDGFISFRYVQNWLAGNGMVYNAGERVEGYTNFLWVAFLGAVMRILPSLDLLRLAQFSGILFGCLTIWLVCRCARTVAGETGPWGLLAGAFLAVHTSFVAWATSGLETLMFALLLFSAAYAYAAFLQSGRHFLLPAVLFSLLPMVRPDGLLLVGVTGLHFVVRECRSRGKLDLKRPFAWGLVVVAIYGAYFVARHAYYGQLLPNTFYAKVMTGTDQYALGWKYLRSYFLMNGAFVFLPAIWLLLRRGRRAWRDYFALLVFAYLGYIVYVGGDGLAFFRFIAHIAPLLYLLVQDGYAELYREIHPRLPRAPHWSIGSALGALIAISLAFTTSQSAQIVLFPERHRWFEGHSGLRFPGLGPDHQYRWFDNYFVDRQKVAARWLEQNAPPNSLVASTPAGSIAYHMSHRVIDMLGLNDIHIAHTESGNIGFPRAGHMKGDGKYVLSRRPDYILLGNVAVLPFALDRERFAEKLIRKSEHEIWAEPEFHRDYELVSVRLQEEGVFQYFNFFRRREPKSAESL